MCFFELEGHFSRVLPETTTLNLTQTDIPASEVERVKQGWQQNFWAGPF